MEDVRILDAITTPRDLKALTDEELAILAQEIREEIIAVTATNGGHVASSLGAVESILAVHSLIDTPEDHLVFDVGHQAYAHKLLTGRREAFETLRQYKGLSGFTKPSESIYDVHCSGHASDSLSIATGLAKARRLKGTDEKIVAFIGDAALSGGMAFEALNYMGTEQLPICIILNDNEMAISRNVGALMRHLGSLRASSSYRTARDEFQERLESNGPLGSAFYHFGKSLKESVKQFVLPHTMIFEQLGIVCTAPIDGHDIPTLKETLSVVLSMDAPVLVHVVTRKGAGYEPAERDPEHFHGVGPYDIATGKPKAKPSAVPSYTAVFGQALEQAAEADERVVAITAAMEGGTGLKPFAQKFPDRFVDVGIAEEQAVAMAAGLAAAGMKPVVAIYSTFMQRAIDQLIIDCALPDFNVVFALDRAGIVGEDGATHHGVFDLVYTRMVPHLRVLAPSDEAELARALPTALALGGPVAIRYPRGTAQGVEIPSDPELLPLGKSRVLREGTDGALLGFGSLVHPALEAAELLAAQGLELRVVDMRWVKPLDDDALVAAAQTPLVVTLEDGVIAGGAGEGVAGRMSELGLEVPQLLLGIPDRFVAHGKPALLYEELGLDGPGIAQAVLQKLQRS